MEGENKISERRKYERFGISFKVSMRILGIFSRPLTVNVQTKNISVEGMQIELSKEGEEVLDLVAYLALDKKEVALNIEIPPKGEWIFGHGWDQDELAEQRYPSNLDLDKAAPNHPVLLHRVCGHLGVVNSEAMNKFTNKVSVLRV